MSIYSSSLIGKFKEVSFKNHKPEKDKYKNMITNIYIKEEEFLELLNIQLCDLDNIIYYTTNMSNFSKDKAEIKKMNTTLKKSKIKAAIENMGWNTLDVNKQKGDLNEYFMCIVIDNLFEDISTLIPKVMLKTNPRMPAYGDDNIFYNKENNMLYFGEAKMYQEFSKALTEAKESILLHEDSTVHWITSNTSNFKNIDGSEELARSIDYEIRNVSEMNRTAIIFITSETQNPRYSDHEYKLSALEESNIEVIALHFPVVNIDTMVENFIEKVGENCE